MLILGTASKDENIKGYTLLELLIVLAVIVIVLSIAAPNFIKYNHNTNLKTAGRDLAGDILNYKQNSAAQSVHHKIIFNKDENKYVILKGGMNSTDPYDETTAITKSFGSVAEYIKIDSAANQIIFQPRGTTAPSGSVTLINDIGSKIKITTSIMGKISVEYTPK